MYWIWQFFKWVQERLVKYCLRGLFNLCLYSIFRIPFGIYLKNFHIAWLPLKKSKDGFQLSKLVSYYKVLSYLNDSFSYCKKSDLRTHKLCWHWLQPILLTQNLALASAKLWFDRDGHWTITHSSNVYLLNWYQNWEIQE